MSLKTIYNPLLEEGLQKVYDDTSLSGRVTTLENNGYKITYYVSVGAAASGTISIPAQATILLDQFEGNIDAYISTTNLGKPTGEFPVTSAGVAVDVSTFDALGNYTLTGAPSTADNALIFVLQIPAKFYENLTKSQIIKELFDYTPKFGSVKIVNSGGYELKFEGGASANIYQSELSQKLFISTNGGDMHFGTSDGGAAFNIIEKNFGFNTTTTDTYALGSTFSYLTYRTGLGANSTAIMNVVADGTGSTHLTFGNDTVRRAVILVNNSSNMEFYTNTSNSGTTVSLKMTLTATGALTGLTSLSTSFVGVNTAVANTHRAKIAASGTEVGLQIAVANNWAADFLSTSTCFRFLSTFTSTNDTQIMGTFSRDSSGTAAAGIGGAIQLTLENAAGVTKENVRLEWKATDVTSAAETGDFILSTINAGTLAEKFRVSGKGNVTIGTAALDTTATDGFLHISSSAGAPTGTPTAYAGRVPIHIDTTNSRIYVYIGGAWKSVAVA